MSSSSPRPPPYDGTGIQYYTIPSFQFSNGLTLPNVRVAYRNYNPSSRHGTILIPTCFGGRINTTLTFPDILSDYHVCVVAMLGNGESSSPSNHPGFPAPGELRYQDVVRSQYRLVTEHLGITHLRAVIGFSMGGQQAYHWGVMYPDFMDVVVPICSSARTGGLNYAFLEGPCTALSRSEDYLEFKGQALKDEGFNRKENRPKKGLGAFGRAYAAWLTSHEWYREMWWNKSVNEGGLGFGCIEDYMKTREEGYYSWDPDDLLVLARMWQMSDVGLVSEEQHGGTGNGKLSQMGGKPGDDDAYEKSLRSIKARVLVMPCRTDQYFPPHDSEIEMKYLKHGILRVIDSVWGHIAGGGASSDAVKFMGQEIQTVLEG